MTTETPGVSAIARAPVETKVAAASAGSGLGSLLAVFVLWLLGVTVWGVPFDAAHAVAAVVAVPSPVAALLSAGLAAAGAFTAGYRAPHTDRGAA